MPSANPDTRFMKRYLRYTVLAAVIFAALLSYSNVIHGELQFDDESFINPSLGHLNLSSFFSLSTLPGYLHGGKVLTLYSFAANYHFDGLNVAGYHIVNIVLHVCTALLVFYFSSFLFSLVPRPEIKAREIGFYPLFVTAFFALHPIQTESVSYIVQRAEILASFWYLACLITLLGYTVSTGRAAFAWWCASAISFLAGWGSKEIIITVPLAYLLCVVYAGGTKYIAKAWRGLLPYCIVGSALICTRLISLSGSTDAGFSSFSPGAQVYAMTQLKVIAEYLLLVIVPLNLNIDHDVATVTTMLSLKSALLFISWLCTLAACLYLLAYYKGVYRSQLRDISFGLLWILVILLPTSSIIPLTDVMFEHRMYLALLGAGIVVMSCANMFFRVILPETRIDVFWLILIITVSTYLGYLTHQRNRVWQTKLTLWTDAAQKSPNKSRPHNNLGNCYLLENNYKAAATAYRTAIRLDPSNIEAYYNLALALKNLGRTGEALQVHRIFVNLVQQKSLDVK